MTKKILIIVSLVVLIILSLLTSLLFYDFGRKIANNCFDYMPNATICYKGWWDLT